MTNSQKYSREDFIACSWSYDVSTDEHYGYSSVMQNFQKCANEKKELGCETQAQILELLGRASSMMLSPRSINNPFSPIFQDFQAGRRSALPDDFTLNELDFFESILDDINDAWVKARLADLLWLCKQPKNPAHAKVAIESYLAHPIESETWRRDVDDCWERASRLAMQIKEYDKLEEIKSQLFGAFSMEFPGGIFMPLWLASLLDKLQIDHDYREDIAKRLLQLGGDLKSNRDFGAARSYFELAAKKFQQSENMDDWLDSLISIAESFEDEADSKSSDSNMVANSFYENAIQAYRRIPSKHRETYGANEKMQAIREKITDTGRASLDEMGLITSPGIDISEMAEASIAHVSEKSTVQEALIYFTGLYSGPEYQKLAESARECMQNSPLSSIIGSSHMSSEGRVVAKTPPANLGAGEDDPANQAVLHRQIQQHFSMEIQLVAKGQILPALRQLLKEHRVTRDVLEEICHHSPLVPEDRVQLLSYALWLGFEHEFGTAIHLICPQLEHVVRVQLKQAGAHTSNIDRDGIENENGLSTLMELPEIQEVFEENTVFEIKSVFTEALGFNLRNEVAHGLLNDNTSYSISTIYAWWMILRILIVSIINGNAPKDTSQPTDDLGEPLDA